MDEIQIKDFLNTVEKKIDLTGDTLVSMADMAFKKYANLSAIKCHNVSITYKQMEGYVNNLASALSAIGIKKGDRVALILPNVMQYPISVFAILKLGAVVVNINPLYTTDEIEYLLDNSGANVAIVLDVMANKLESLVAKSKLKHVIVTQIADLYPLIKRSVFGFVIKYIKRLNVKFSYKSLSFREMVIKYSPQNYQVSVNYDDLAFIQYTGATTGRPKGAMLSHRNIVANVTQVYTWYNSKQLQGGLENHIVICALPLYHIFSLTANLFAFFFKGGQIVMVPNPRDIGEVMKVLKNNKFTFFNALDTLYNHLLNSPEFVNTKYPSFKYSISGGMSIRDKVVQRWTEVTGVIPTNCYGLTEASPAVTMSIFNAPYDGSIGYPLPSTEIEIRDLNTRKSLVDGEIGALFIRGPQVMSGYWQNEEQTKLILDQDGWLNTKDLAYIKDSKVFLTGRQSDMIIVSGFNVYPAEVERVLDAFPEIEDSAVIGINDDETGESVVAYIVLKPSFQIDEIEIRHKCKELIAAYKVPKHIIIADDLPKTLVGKIDKVKLLNEYLKK